MTLKAGCCDDGNQCDELCVEIAAAYLCRQEHAEKQRGDSSCRDDCCTPSDIGEAPSPCCGESSMVQAKNIDSHPYCSDTNFDEAEIPTLINAKSGGTQCGIDEKISNSNPRCCTERTMTEPLIITADCCTNNANSDRPTSQRALKPPCISIAYRKLESEDGCGGGCCASEEYNPITTEALSNTSSDYCGTTKQLSAKQNCCQTNDSCSVVQPMSKTEGKISGQTCCSTKPTRQTSVKCVTKACCIEDSSSDYSETKTSCSSSIGEYEPCAAHLEAAFNQFTAFLEAGLCICRNVLARSDTCCDEKKRAAASKARARRGATNSGNSALKPLDPTSQCRKQTIQTSCHSAKPETTVSVCCAEHVEETAQTIPHSSRKNHKHASPGVGVNKDGVQNSTVHEHITFKIDGMDCSGCVKQITGLSIPGVFQISASFVAGRGDCYVDTHTISINQALEQLQRKSGFKCSQIVSNILTLDLLMTEEQSKCLENGEYDRIHSVKRLKSGLYRVSFDPSVIGARTVLSRSSGVLGPPCKEDVLANGRKEFLTELWLFLMAALLTVPVVVLSWADVPTVSYNIKSTICLVLGTLVQTVAIPEFYIPALKALFYSKVVEMDMLVVISITAAYGYSVVAYGMTHAGYILREGELFETSTLLITLVILGRLLSAYAKVKAVGAISLKSLQSGTAYLYHGKDHDEQEVSEIDARLLEYDDMIKIPPHSSIVTDGEVVQGITTVDESMITGESTPVVKIVGSTVIAGTNNGVGQLVVRTTRLPGQNSISDIADLVTNAMETKPRVQDLADVLAGYFVPVVMCIATVVFVIWLLVALKIRREDAGGAIGISITYAIAVLAITCPCALGLAVPLVLVIAGGVAAKAGVVIKSASSTESGHTITDAVFDKTGTLTTGELYVVHEKIVTQAMTEEEVSALTLSLVEDNQHPVSQSVTAHLRSHKASSVRLTDIVSEPGAGIRAKWDTDIVGAGNPAWLGVESHQALAALGGLTHLCVTRNGELLAVYGLSAMIRPEAARVISQLQMRNVQCHIVSGDNSAAVMALATSLNVAGRNVQAHYSPEKKRDHIQTLQRTVSETGSRRKVLFIGDGTNDAGAIAQADIGLQIGDTSDVSRAAADVVLLGGLDGIITLLDVSKASYHRIMFNFVWSGVYNVFAILLASGAFVKFRVPPAYAGLGEIVSVLPVILVAASLARVKLPKA